MTHPADLQPPRTHAEDEPKATFMEHLEELRKRIFRALIYIMLGWVVAFAITPYVYDFLAGPLLRTKPEGAKFVFTHATEPFF
jgi:sec-independent protein translocase protein TatC